MSLLLLWAARCVSKCVVMAAAADALASWLPSKINISRNSNKLKPFHRSGIITRVASLLVKIWFAHGFQMAAAGSGLMLHMLISSNRGCQSQAPARVGSLQGFTTRFAPVNCLLAGLCLVEK